MNLTQSIRSARMMPTELPPNMEGQDRPAGALCGLLEDLVNAVEESKALQARLEVRLAGVANPRVERDKDPEKPSPTNLPAQLQELHGCTAGLRRLNDAMRGLMARLEV